MCLVIVSCHISVSKLTGNWVEGLDLGPMKISSGAELNLQLLYDIRYFHDSENFGFVLLGGGVIVQYSLGTDVSEKSTRFQDVS